MAQQKTRLEYDSLPAVTPSYLRAATTLSGGLSTGETIPPITAKLSGLEVRAEPLARYRKVCGFARSEHLPATYPHVLAFPMHMAVMTHKQFPLKLLGLIHVRNEITQHRYIGAGEPLDLAVTVNGHRDVSKGIEFDLVTRIHDRAGELIWEEVGTMLSRLKRSKKSSKANGKDDRAPERPGLPESAQETEWQVPEDIGRRYAAAAGDYNPIHLSALSAKLFGFPRAIATGMWMKARAAAELEPGLTSDAYTLSLAFRKPVFLPSKTSFGYAFSDEGARFALTDMAGDVLHLSGEVLYR